MSISADLVRAGWARPPVLAHFEVGDVFARSLNNEGPMHAAISDSHGLEFDGSAA